MKTDDLIALTDKNIMRTYNRTPVVLVKGSGALVWDSEGKAYLDFVAGIAVCSLGHAHPRVVEAIREQAGVLMHVSNLYYTEPQVRLAKLLVENSFADKVFFCNSGAEANEAAIKLARKFAYETRGPGRSELITMRNSFHGRTLTTVTATGQEKFQIGFEPLPRGFKYVPYDDLDALEAAITDETCGVMLEVIQGEAGVIIPDIDYLHGVRRLCDKKGILMILDEVQTGMGRTGSLFAHQDYGVTPDIMTLAKALGNGFPIGATLATDRLAGAFVPGNHASTFGGNPLATAAAIATVETILNDGVLDNCRRVGAFFLDRLKGLADRHGMIRNVRGKGLMVALELDIPGADIVRKCMEKGVLINCTNNNILRCVPPLIVTEMEVDQVVSVIDEAMRSL
ncbi:MAG: acetylornithine transaminase [Deltaproteobacteria bacterium]|nr:acetylornithine transaminase [Deltaproteobacteria bacterium]